MNIYRQLLVFLLYTAVHVVKASHTVTSGPIKCDKKEMVSKGKEISVHYDVYFEESSATREPGELIETSYGAPGPYTFTNIGTFILRRNSTIIW